MIWILILKRGTSVNNSMVEVIGFRQKTNGIKNRIRIFLRDRIHLTLSHEKTFITNFGENLC